MYVLVATVVDTRRERNGPKCVYIKCFFDIWCFVVVVVVFFHYREATLYSSRLSLMNFPNV